jgi:hypothetical protein
VTCQVPFRSIQQNTVHRISHLEDERDSLLSQVTTLQKESFRLLEQGRIPTKSDQFGKAANLARQLEEHTDDFLDLKKTHHSTIEKLDDSEEAEGEEESGGEDEEADAEAEEVDEEEDVSEDEEAEGGEEEDEPEIEAKMMKKRKQKKAKIKKQKEMRKIIKVKKQKER